ncbi:MAG: heavy metal translocating P-type ATPase [Candidatus Heimdallarchaeota archaeon]
MQDPLETIKLEIRDYLSPECSCKVEDMVNTIEHVTDSAFDPVNNLLMVTVTTGKVTAEDIIAKLKQCAVRCELGRPAHEQAHREHEAMKMKHPALHDHHAMMEAEMKQRFFVTLLVTIPVLLLSPTIQKWVGFSLPAFPGARYLLFFLATLIAGYGGIVFYRGANKSLRLRVLDMNVLISIAVISGYLYSVGATFFFEAVDFYWEISTLVVFLLFGHWMEMKAVRGASGALKELVKLIPPTANLIENGEVVEVPTSELQVNHILLVRPGEKVPIDGVVIEGETNVNEAMITGESKPVNKTRGSEVIGGTINGEGAIRVQVTKTGEETTLAQIIKLVQEAQTSKPRTQKLADRAAHYLTLVAILVGGATFAFWWGIIGTEGLFALTLTITVIVIACPHALGLAIPTVTSISTTMAAQKGMLVKNAEALERSKELDIVVFDKTGTLTKGEFGVTDIVEVGDWTESELLSTAAAIETNSEHVIAKGIVKKAQEAGVHTKKAKQFEAIPGKGATAFVDGEETYIGNANLIRQLGISPEAHEEEVARLSSQGKTVVYIATKQELQGLIALADLIRDESREAVRSLRAVGVEAAMLTGDNRQTAEFVAKELGLHTFFAEVLPEDKAQKIKELQGQGKRVAMVGDGINDAPALVQADVGVAIGAGTDVAIESADIVLVKNDPRDVAKLIALSKKTMRKMQENLVWATGYNAAAIPLAAGALLPFGIQLRPEWAALIMAASSILVVSNALLLKRAEL